MKRYILVLSLTTFISHAQECPSIASICNDYEEVEYVLVGRGDTTAVISKANVAADLGLTKEVKVFYTDNGKFTVLNEGSFSIIYAELFDGRTGTTISRL